MDGGGEHLLSPPDSLQSTAAERGEKNHFTILCLQSNYVWTIHVQPSHDLASGHLWIELGYTLARALERSPSCFKSSHPWVALTKDLVRMCDAYMTTSLQLRRANG